jgi:hypothetical protein
LELLRLAQAATDIVCPWGLAVALARLPVGRTNLMVVTMCPDSFPQGYCTQAAVVLDLT